MNKTLSFAKLDYLTVKPYITLKNILIFSIVFAIIGYRTDDPSAIIGIMMMYGTIYVTSPFAVGDKNGIDTLYATLPLTKKNIVVGRYVFALFLNVIVGAIAVAISAIFMFVFGKEINWIETLIIIMVYFVVFTILQSIQLPIHFKLGYAKAKFLAYLPFAALPAAVIVISKLAGKNSFLPFLKNTFSWIETNSLLSIILVIIIWVLIVISSISLSYRFYKKREI